MNIWDKIKYYFRAKRFLHLVQKYHADNSSDEGKIFVGKFSVQNRDISVRDIESVYLYLIGRLFTPATHYQSYGVISPFTHKFVDLGPDMLLNWKEGQLFEDHEGNVFDIDEKNLEIEVALVPLQKIN